MAIAKQLTVRIENRPGTLATLCSELARLAVNIHAIQACEAKSAEGVRLIVSHSDVARRVCTSLGHKYTEEDVLTVKVGDRPGSLGKLTRKLAEKGINIEYVYGSIAKGSTQALIVLGVSDVAAAANILK